MVALSTAVLCKRQSKYQWAQRQQANNLSVCSFVCCIARAFSWTCMHAMFVNSAVCIRTKQKKLSTQPFALVSRLHKSLYFHPSPPTPTYLIQPTCQQSPLKRRPRGSTQQHQQTRRPPQGFETFCNGAPYCNWTSKRATPRRWHRRFLLGTTILAAIWLICRALRPEVRASEHSSFPFPSLVPSETRWPYHMKS